MARLTLAFSFIVANVVPWATCDSMMTTPSTTTATALVACVRDASETSDSSESRRECSDGADATEGFMGAPVYEGRFMDKADKNYENKCWIDEDVPVACCHVEDASGLGAKTQYFRVCCDPMQECSAGCETVRLKRGGLETLCSWPCRKRVSFDVTYELSIDYNLQLDALDTSTTYGGAPHFQSADGYHVQQGSITQGVKAALAEMFRDRDVSRESLIFVNSSLSPSEGTTSSTSHKLFLKISEAAPQDTTSLKPTNFFGSKDLTCAYFKDELEKYLRYFNCGEFEDYCLPLDGLVVKRVDGQMSYSMEKGALVVGRSPAVPLASVSLSVMAALFMSLLLSCR